MAKLLNGYMVAAGAAIPTDLVTIPMVKNLIYLRIAINVYC